MTNMKRMTVSLTDDIVARLEELRKKEAYKSKTYSELLRDAIAIGLKKQEAAE